MRPIGPEEGARWRAIPRVAGRRLATLPLPQSAFDPLGTRFILTFLDQPTVIASSAATKQSMDCHGALRAPRNDKRLEIMGRWY